MKAKYWDTPESRATVAAAGYEWDQLADWEVLGILDDMANGDDVEDGLAERRYWHSAEGRAALYREAWESGRI